MPNHSRSLAKHSVRAFTSPRAKSANGDGNKFDQITDINPDRLRRWMRLSLSALFILGLIAMCVPLLASVIVGGLFSLALCPSVESLARKIKNRTLVVSLVVLVFVLGGVLPTAAVSYRVVTIIREKVELQKQNAGDNPVKSLRSEIIGKGTQKLSHILNPLGLSPETVHSFIDESIGKLEGGLAKMANAFMASIGNITVQLFIFLVSVFYFLQNSARVKKVMRHTLGLETAQFQDFLTSLQDACKAILVSNVVVGALQALIVSVGAKIFGFHEFVLIFVVTFFVSFIPVIGAAPVAFALSIYSLMQGDLTSFWGLLVTTVIAGTADNIARPLLVSGRSDVPGLLGLVAVIGGVLVLGIPGLFIGPLLAALVVHSIPKLLHKSKPVPST